MCLVRCQTNGACLVRCQTNGVCLVRCQTNGACLVRCQTNGACLVRCQTNGVCLVCCQTNGVCLVCFLTNRNVSSKWLSMLRNNPQTMTYVNIAPRDMKSPLCRRLYQLAFGSTSYHSCSHYEQKSCGISRNHHSLVPPHTQQENCSRPAFSLKTALLAFATYFYNRSTDFNDKSRLCILRPICMQTDIKCIFLRTALEIV